MHRCARRLLTLLAAAFVFGSLGLISRPAHALLGDSLGLSPFWDWKTIETEHFRVTFPASLEAAAQKEAGYLEEAHSVLSPKLYWQPWYKTQILVIDNADLANGLTSPQLRFGLVLWITPPDPWFSTAYYDDWLRLLAFHEYTHLLNMDNVQDFYVPLRYLTGDVLLPNSAWPSWMLEGLAVYDETRYTHGGRGRSPLYEMMLRSAVEEHILGTSEFYKIDQFNGTTPYNPDGEAVYLFGYQLMNEVAHEPVPYGRTADGADKLKDGEDALGVMSLRSAARIPYLINGNLKNIIGKDWYELWDQWIGETRARADEQLARIRSRPTSRLTHLTPSDGIETLGPAISPDGKWLSYTSDTPDRRSGIYLMDLKTGESRRVDDKDAGAAAAFTPDSRSVVYSDVERYQVYYQFSDLEAFDLDRNRTYQITHGLRARDPDVSPDGHSIVFTLTENQTTGLAMAPLDRDASSGKLQLGQIHRLPVASTYDRVTAPRFSRDGKRIIYSIHHEGHLSEELMAWDLGTGAAVELVANGKFNRYPAPAPDGSLYFISDLTGVENLYRLPPGAAAGAVPELATNVTSGLSTPSIAASGEIYAAAYASHGWSIVRVAPLSQVVHPSDVTIAPPPAPKTDELSSDHSKQEHHEVKDYSIFPSIWPRQWLLVPELYPGGLYLQEAIEGFDAVDRHDYLVGLGYNTQIPDLDWSATYSNRQLGPTITLYAADHTTSFGLNDSGVTDYTRKYEGALQLSYIIQWTYSSLVPAFTVGGSRILSYFRGYDPDNGDLVGNSPSVTTADVSFSYTNAETARLSISPEAGRTLVGGVRLYSDPASGQDIYKGVVKDAEYIRLYKHNVLVPSLKGAWSSGFDFDYGDANAVVQGRTPGLIPTTLGAIFDPLAVRGYPQALFFSRAATVGALDLRVPLLQIFRGWGTNPVFLDNAFAFGFVEGAYFPTAVNVPVLSSAGGGITLNTEVFLHIPLALTVECDQGFQSAYGGKTDLFVALNVGSLQL